MCGISGIISPNGRRDLRGDIAAMNRALVHRGPDDEGSHIEPAFGLGFRRLAILDLSPAGHQPMRSPDGALVLVFNGEIYNYLELAAELRALGHHFKSSGDAEVVLHAYAEWGEACVQRFNGMWAFAIWDRPRQRLFASRDRFGVKPLVYHQQGAEFIFSSEVAGLRAVLPLHRANPGKLHDFLAYGYRSNDGQTFFEAVQELPPAHNLTFERGELTLSRWWSLPQDQPPPAGDRSKAWRDLLQDAVRLRFRSDVPVALLQSGGLDSSAICCLVNDDLAQGLLPPQSVMAFTAVHPGHAFDESQALRELMASCPQVRSVELALPWQGLAEQMPAFVRAMQQPMFSSTAYAHWCLMAAVHAQGIKVVINGQGADEALAGYGRHISGYHLLDTLLRQPQRLPAEMAAQRRLMGQGLLMQLGQLAKAMLGRRAAARWRGAFSEGGARLLAPAFKRAHRERLEDVGPRWGGGNLDAQLRAQLLHYGFNQILNYEDQSSMSHSVEIRSPFVDWRLMEMAFALPAQDKLGGGITKRILREAFAQRLPSSIINNHHKIGFATPFDEWSATPAFRAWVRELVQAPEFIGRKLWQGHKLAARLQDPAAVRRGFPAWRFIMAELWMREFGIHNV